MDHDDAVHRPPALRALMRQSHDGSSADTQRCLEEWNRIVSFLRLPDMSFGGIQGFQLMQRYGKMALVLMFVPWKLSADLIAIVAGYLYDSRPNANIDDLDIILDSWEAWCGNMNIFPKPTRNLFGSEQPASKREQKRLRITNKHGQPHKHDTVLARRMAERKKALKH